VQSCFKSRSVVCRPISSAIGIVVTGGIAVCVGVGQPFERG
jgi:hypothetical protein